MGLGPPVCLDCMRVMRFSKESPWWVCPKCGKDGSKDAGVSHLLSLTDDQMDECRRNNSEAVAALTMTARTALIRCISVVSINPEDGEYHSISVYDRNGDSHWVAWSVADGDDAAPRLCSESGHPFARSLEPYRATR